MGLFVNGTNGAIFALMSEAYPTVARATAQNVLWNLARAVGALGPLAIGALVAKYSFQGAIGFLASIYMLDIIRDSILDSRAQGKAARVRKEGTMHIKSSRRNFLRSSAVLGTTCMLGSTARPTSGESSVSSSRGCVRRNGLALQLAQRGMHVTLLDAWGRGILVPAQGARLAPSVRPTVLRTVCITGWLPEPSSCGRSTRTMESETFLFGAERFAWRDPMIPMRLPPCRR